MITLNTSAGIEIRDNQLILVCLKRGLQDISVAGSKIIDNYQQIPRAELRQMLQAFFRDQRIRRENVIFGVPRHQVVLRFLSLPAETKPNLPSIMKFQVEGLEPSEENGSYYDWCILDEGKGEGSKISLLLAMVRKSCLDEYLLLFKEAQIPLQGIQVSTFALWRLLAHAGRETKQEPSFIFDFSSQRHEVIGWHHRQLIFSALSARPQSGEESGAPLSVEELVRDLENALSASHMPNENIDKLYFSGPQAEWQRRAVSAELPEASLLTSHLRLRTKVGMAAELPSLATPIELALEGLKPRQPAALNLLPPGLRIQRSRYAYVPTYVLLLVLMLLTSAYFLRPIYQEKAFMQEIDEEIASLKPQVDEVEKIRRENQQLEGKIAYLQQLFCATDHNLEVLGELTTTMLDDTYLQYYSNKEGDVMFQGMSMSASSLLTLLSKSAYMKNIEPAAPITRDSVSGKERFNLKAKVEGKGCN